MSPHVVKLIVFKKKTISLRLDSDYLVPPPRQMSATGQQAGPSGSKTAPAAPCRESWSTTPCHKMAREAARVKGLPRTPEPHQECEENRIRIQIVFPQYLGFCALCLSAGALVPSNVKVGVIKARGQRYGFCSVKMAARFSKDPQRYVNEVLDYARNNPHVINLLNIVEEVYKVKEVDTLVTKYVPKIKVMDRDIQTEAHPVDGYIEKNYTWDLWEWKRRACQWAKIVKCQTHSTQTIYSHLRSEIQCQTVEPRDKSQQTKRDCGVNTQGNDVFLWGLRGQIGTGQHAMSLGETHAPDNMRARVLSTCTWPCVEPGTAEVCTGLKQDFVDQ